MPEEFNPFAAPQAVDSPSPHEAWATDHPEALRRVKTGLNCVYFGICGILLAALSMPFLGMMVFAQGPGVAPAGIAWFGMAIAGVMIALTLLILVGEMLCTAVPSESGGKTLAIVAAVTHGLSIVIGMVAQFILGGAGFNVVMGAQVVGYMLWLASFFCLVIFMRRVAKYIRRDDLVGRATRVLVVGGVTLMLFVGTFVFTSVDGPQNEFPWLRGLFLIAGLMAFVSLIMYANMVTYLRKAITA